MDEVWKPIKGYEGVYEVSNLGAVRRVAHDIVSHRANCDAVVHLGAHLMTPQNNGVTNRDGRHYQSVALKGKTYLVHRLVAEAFCERPEGCDIVNHIDSNPENNRADNLEWTTYKGNTQHSIEAGRMTRNLDGLALGIYATMTPVIVTMPDGTERTYRSQSDAARDLGISDKHIPACCRGKYKQLNGYKFRYAGEPRKPLAS